MGFPVSIEGEVTLAGAGRPLEEWRALVVAALEHEGGRVTPGGGSIAFTATTTPWGLAFSTSELSLADSGVVTVAHGSDDVHIRYTLSTRRALVLATLTAVAIAIALWRDAGPVWAPFAAIVIWSWLFGWNWLAQRWRAAGLFEELGAPRA